MDIFWSTNSVPPVDRVSCWCAELSRLVLRVRVEVVRPEVFRGEFRLRRFGPTAFLAVRSEAQRILRGPAEIGRQDGAWQFVSTMIEGEGLLHHPSGTETVPPGGVSFVDGDQPFQLEFAGPFSYVSVAVLRRDMLAILPAAAHAHGRVLPAPAGPALSSFMTVLEQAVDRGDGIGIGDENRLYDHLIGLAAASLITRSVPPGPSPDAALLAEIKSYLEANLGLDLPSRAVAGHFGISDRKLQRLFQTERTTLSRWLRLQRLDRCAHDLADPLQSGRTLTMIAAARGFDDMSYFSRSFREAFGVSPTAYRRAARSGSTSAG